jgi:hypothetical protein
MYRSQIFKRTFIIVTLLAGWSVFAQDYSFDYLITSTQRKVSKNHEFSPKANGEKRNKMQKSHLINAQNSDYRLLFYYDAYEKDRTTGSIGDEKNRLNHSYKLLPAKAGDDIGFRLGYVGTYPWNESGYRAVNVTVRKVKDMIYEITAELSNSKKHKLTVFLQESPDDLTNTIRPDVPDQVKREMISELKIHLDPDKNYFISEYITQYIPGSTFHVRTEAKKLKEPLQVQIINKKQ